MKIPTTYTDSHYLLPPDIPTLVQRCLKVEQDRSLSDNSMKELRRYLSEFSSYCQGKNIYFADELTPVFMKTYASTSGERPFPKMQQKKQEILSILPGKSICRIEQPIVH